MQSVYESGTSGVLFALEWVMTVSKFKGNNVFIIFSRRSSRVAGLEQQEETAGDSIRVRVCPRIPVRHIFCLLPAGPRNTAPFPDARVL